MLLFQKIFEELQCRLEALESMQAGSLGNIQPGGERLNCGRMNLSEFLPGEKSRNENDTPTTDAEIR